MPEWLWFGVMKAGKHSLSFRPAVRLTVLDEVIAAQPKD